MQCSRLLFVTLLCTFSFVNVTPCGSNKPIVLATWSFINATKAAWHVLHHGETAVNAVLAGGTSCEFEPCAASVGYGGSPDEHGETALDAMIMDGSTYDVGAVANLRNIKNAIGVAHAVMKHTQHTFLVGSSATEFAVTMGFPQVNLSTPESLAQWLRWKNASCQPNFWKNVVPDPRTSCGPYSPIDHNHPETSSHAGQEHNVQMLRSSAASAVNEIHHDTVGIIALDVGGNIAGGTTTNGATFKIPGRVGDSPIVGSGAYADNTAGAAAATGDGDLMMRFLPSFIAVEQMRNGAEPSAAAATAISRISRIYPSSHAAVIALNTTGGYGAACHGFSKFTFTVMSAQFAEVQLVNVPCTART